MNIYIYMCKYIFIYIYMYICTNIYIYLQLPAEILISHISPKFINYQIYSKCRKYF